jgi:hypothetical protein
VRGTGKNYITCLSVCSLQDWCAWWRTGRIWYAVDAQYAYMMFALVSSRNPWSWEMFEPGADRQIEKASIRTVPTHNVHSLKATRWNWTFKRFSTYCSESTTKLKSVFTIQLDKVSKSPGAGALVAPCFLAPWGETTSRSHQLRGDAAERRFTSDRFNFLGVMYGFIYRIFMDMWYMDIYGPIEQYISYLGWLWNIMDNLGSRLGY